MAGLLFEITLFDGYYLISWCTWKFSLKIFKKKNKVLVKSLELRRLSILMFNMSSFTGLWKQAPTFQIGWLSLLNYVPFVPFVPTCLTCLTCLCTLRAYVPACLCVSNCYVPTCLGALKYYVPTCLCALNYYVPTCLRVLD